MKKHFYLNAAAILTTVILATSCGNFNPGPVPENIVGDAPGELEAKICDLMKVAGTDSTKVEFAEITSTFIYRPNDNNAHAHIQIISPDDKNKMEQLDWNDMKERRNSYEKYNLTVSTRLSEDLIDTYEGYKDMLFTYSDIKKYLDNLPAYCEEAIEASGYKDNAYISNFEINVDGASISVSHKEGNISKTYGISPDGSHIIIPE